MTIQMTRPPAKVAAPNTATGTTIVTAMDLSIFEASSSLAMPRTVQSATDLKMQMERRSTTSQRQQQMPF